MSFLSILQTYRIYMGSKRRMALTCSNSTLSCPEDAVVLLLSSSICLPLLENIRLVAVFSTVKGVTVDMRQSTETILIKH